MNTKKFITLAVAAGVVALGIAIYTAKSPSQAPAPATDQKESTAPASNDNKPENPSETKPDAAKNDNNAAVPSAEGQDQVVATYNGASLKKSEINEKLQAVAGVHPDGKKPSFDDLPDNVKTNIVRGIVISKLISAEATKANLENDPSVQKKIADMKDQVIQQEFITRKIKAETTEDKIKQRYDEFVKEWGDKEEIKARHILVSTEQEAKDVLEELKKGVAFEEVAKKRSKDSNKDKGGDLGYFSKGQMVKPFEDAAFALKAGETSAPVKTDFGWHVIKVEDKRKAEAPKYEDIKPRLEAEVSQKIIQNYVDKLLADANFQATGDGKQPAPATDNKQPDADNKPAADTAAPAADSKEEPAANKQ